MKNFKLSYIAIQELAEKSTSGKNGGYVTSEDVYNVIVEALTSERMLDAVEKIKVKKDIMVSTVL